MIQDFVNKNFFRLLLFTLIFGVIFYDTIGFAFTDEICSLLLLVLYLKYVFSTAQWEVNKMFLVTTGVFLFYLCYSFYIGSNSKAGILTDFIIQYKPYLGFFCVYAIKPVLSEAQKKLVCQICLILGGYLFLIGVAYVVSESTIYATMKHPSRLATAVSIVSLLYLYCSNYTGKDKVIFILLMAVGLCSGRSKFIGFFIICVMMVLFILPSFKLKFNLKNIVLLSISLAIVLFFTYKKIDLYFISGGNALGDNEEIQDSIARAALYFYSTDIFVDFFPFGSGFASYATYASGAYYSPIYELYGLDDVYGLSKRNGAFISDTYYPVLAQFGVMGVVLFFSFWVKLSLKSLSYYKSCNKEALIGLMIVGFFLIECTSDSTLTHNRGLFMMMLLGLVFSDMRNTKYDQQITTKNYG